MSASSTDSAPFGSPAQVGVDRYTDTAHRLIPMGREIERFGVTVCGYPAEYLTVLRDLAWTEVTNGRRCLHCQAADATDG